MGAVVPGRYSGWMTAAVAVVLFILYGIVGRMDYDDEQLREQAARTMRELVMAAQWCGPKPGQRAVQEWRSGKLRCEIYEVPGPGRAKRLVARLEAPALAHPLGTSEGEE